ncbi:unnamed protein product [Lupinus luteus]|uniref:Uncharacterized protein n=1 Tax=Lupinus luteus TaxID=3873 RepID=A0AAV1Y0S8_LUPLU
MGFSSLGRGRQMVGQNCLRRGNELTNISIEGRKIFTNNVKIVLNAIVILEIASIFSCMCCKRSKTNKRIGTISKSAKLVKSIAKWMLSKGQGRAMGSYFTLLNALAEDDGLDKAEELWTKLLMQYSESLPSKFFNKMISIYNKRRMHEKIENDEKIESNSDLNEGDTFEDNSEAIDEQFEQDIDVILTELAQISDDL